MFDLIKANTTSNYRKPQVSRSFYAYIVVSLLFCDRSIPTNMLDTKPSVCNDDHLCIKLCYFIKNKNNRYQKTKKTKTNKQTNTQTNICTAHFDDFFLIKIHIHMEESIATEINKI